MDGKELERLLVNETNAIKVCVQNIEENIAGHIVFLDPIAKYPNLIQAIQLLAIHENHHFLIIENIYKTMHARSIEV